MVHLAHRAGMQARRSHGTCTFKYAVHKVGYAQLDGFLFLVCICAVHVLSKRAFNPLTINSKVFIARLPRWVPRDRWEYTAWGNRALSVRHRWEHTACTRRGSTPAVPGEGRFDAGYAHTRIIAGMCTHAFLQCCGSHNTLPDG